MVGSLTKKQTKHYDAVRWLLSPGPRGGGRTTLMALCFIDIALQTGMLIEVFDHHSTHRDAQREMLRRVVEIAATMKNIKLTTRSDGRILVVWNPSQYEIRKDQILNKL